MTCEHDVVRQADMRVEEEHADPLAELPQQEPWARKVIEQTGAERGIEAAEIAEVGVLEVEPFHLHAVR